MPREPIRLSRSILGQYRPGVAVAVAMGLAVGVHPRGQRPTGYGLRSLVDGSAVASAATAPPGPGTAVLEIRGALTEYESDWDCGELMGYDRIAADFKRAHEDLAVGALVVDCNSPGGDVNGIAECIEKCRAAKKASAKSTIGYVGSLAASGGIWLLSGICDAIVLHPSARVGSVGSVVAHESEARMLADAGIDVTILRDPPGKMNPNPHEELDELGRQRLQSLASEGTARFLVAMMTFRDLDPETVRGWNGGMFTGAAALDVDLVDALGSLVDALAWASELTEGKAAA